MFKELRTGIIYSAMGKYSTLMINLIVQAILARLLSPEEFGVVAVVNVFIIFFQLLADFGIGPAIIQNKELNEKDIGEIFTFSIYISLLFSLVFSLSGNLISVFYENEAYKQIVPILGINLFFSSVLIVPLNLSQKKKEFKYVNIVRIIGTVISGLTSIILGLKGFSYYSIIFGNTLRAIFLFIVYYSRNTIKFNFRVTPAPLKKIYTFSSRQFLFNFINYFSRNLDSLLISRYMSESALGFYNKAYQVSLYPNQILTSVITPVIQPILSNYEKESGVLKNVYLTITSILSSIGIPLSIFLFYSSEEIIYILFGDQWGASIPIFKILSLSIWVQMISSSTGAIFQSGNRTDLLLTSGILSTIINISAVVLGLISGDINNIALYIVISFTINLLQVNILLFWKLFKSSLTEFLLALLKPFFMGLVQMIVFSLLPMLEFHTIINLMIKIVIFILVFILTAMATGQFKILYKLLKQ